MKKHIFFFAHLFIFFQSIELYCSLPDDCILEVASHTQGADFLAYTLLNQRIRHISIQFLLQLSPQEYERYIPKAKQVKDSNEVIFLKSLFNDYVQNNVIQLPHMLHLFVQQFIADPGVFSPSTQDQLRKLDLYKIYPLDKNTQYIQVVDDFVNKYSQKIITTSHDIRFFSYIVFDHQIFYPECEQIILAYEECDQLHQLNYYLNLQEFTLEKNTNAHCEGALPCNLYSFNQSEPIRNPDGSYSTQLFRLPLFKDFLLTDQGRRSFLKLTRIEKKMKKFFDFYAKEYNLEWLKNVIKNSNDIITDQ